MDYQIIFANKLQKSCMATIKYLSCNVHSFVTPKKIVCKMKANFKV